MNANRNTNPLPTSPIRFMQHYVTNGTTKARVFYGLDNDRDRKCVTIYARDYSRDLGRVLPAEYRNATEIETDYFDQGHVTLTEEHPLYAAARERAESVIAARAAKRERKFATV